MNTHWKKNHNLVKFVDLHFNKGKIWDPYMCHDETQEENCSFDVCRSAVLVKSSLVKHANTHKLEFSYEAYAMTHWREPTSL